MKGPRSRGSKGARTAPQFAYFLETIQQPVTPKHPAWLLPLPLSRHTFSGTFRQLPEASVTVGDYFQTVRSFLEGAGREGIVRSLRARGVDAPDAKAFRIFLAKHGEYYHPARVETEIHGRSFHWVVNAAVSTVGRSLLLKEHALLEKLKREFPGPYIPDVYGTGELDAGHGRSVAMFLGEWFSGFHEFHLTRNTSGAQQALILWDVDNGRRTLDSGQARAIYYEVALILTHYLNLTTLEGIGAWHHAAGDFVVRLKGAHPEVRLITVREYHPLFRFRRASDDPAREIQTLLERLLIFLLNLSIRTRLDRLDGTGEMAWSDPVAVEATVAGMLAGLAEKPPIFELPLDQLFRRYLAGCSATDLLELCDSIAANYQVEAPETPVVKAQFKEHTEALSDALGRL